MRMKLLTLAISLLTAISLQAQTNEHYIKVTGTSEIEIVPDKIHYLIEIREYFEEEFDGKSKPEQYRTKVPLHKIEQGVKKVLSELNVPQNAIKTQEIGDYWRQQGQDFLVSKRLDITLTDFSLINEIVKCAKADTPCPAVLNICIELPKTYVGLQAANGILYFCNRLFCEG